MILKSLFNAGAKHQAPSTSTPARVPERPLRTNDADCWLSRTNPLVGVSIRTAQAIFDAARAGDTQRLHWLYQEIEAKDPVLMTCIERRSAAIANFTWNVSARPNADKVLAEEQQAAALELIGNITNFTELLEHLDSSFFRGFALAQPVWNADGKTLGTVELHDSWEFLKKDGVLYWNPGCNGFGRDAVDCRDAGLIGVERTRAIDYPALAIYLRHAVSERDWGRFLERYALPKPAVTMAPNATNAQRNDYLVAARAVENGQVSVWPSGSTIADFAGGSRGVDPFQNFIRHQEELIVLLATGGTLTSLAAADTGALAGGAQMEVWKQIVNRDAGVLSQAVQAAIVRPFLERNFWGRPVAADFALTMPFKMTPQEAANVAATLKQAGWRVDQSELEKAVGFTLEREETQPQLPMPSFGAAKKRFAAAKHPNADDVNARIAENDNARLLEAFAADMSPAADAITHLLNNPTKEAAEELIGKMDDLMPDDPAMAAILAEAMANEFVNPNNRTIRTIEQ